MISVIVPVYNVQEYILHCLESISIQTFRGEIECIIVDDCGSDNSINIVNEFLLGYRGPIDFRIIHHSSNKGLSCARNTGLCEAKGEFISFIDGDDWIEPNMLESLFEKLNRDDKAFFITSCIVAETPNGTLQRYANTDSYIEGESMSPYDFLKLMLSCKTNNSPCNKLYRRTFIKKLFQAGKICEDYLFFFDNCIELFDLDCHFLMTENHLYHYLLHGGSITNQPKASERQWYLDWLENMVYVADICVDKYPELYYLQFESFERLYISCFYSLITNKAIVCKRRKTLSDIEHLARKIDLSRLNKLMQLDMFISLHIPFGYKIDRLFVCSRLRLKKFMHLS